MAGFTVNATVLKQNGRELYCFGVNSKKLDRISYVTPRSKDDPEEVQRILSDKRAQEIGEYIKQANSLLPNAIVVSLTDDVQVQDTGTPGIKALYFPDEEGKFAYVLDGQHRLRSFEHSDGVQFDLPVVAVYDADNALRGKIFADINSKQERVSDVHLLSLYYQIKELPADETPLMDVITRLNTDPDSPLKDRIKVMDSDKATWVSNAALKKWLSPHLTSGGVLSTKTVAERAHIVKCYFTAVSHRWPEAWAEHSKFNLCRPIGFEIMLSIFADVKHRCDLNCGKQYTAENFHSQMIPIKDATISLPGGGLFTLDWQRGIMGHLSGKTGKTLIGRQLKDLLRTADEN
jgi:DGQHR domain-containing protein